jgi:hypothetical protein
MYMTGREQKLLFLNTSKAQERFKTILKFFRIIAVQLLFQACIFTKIFSF